MKTIPLEEVLKLATPGKLAVLGNCLVTNSDEFLMAHDPIIGHADYGPIDAALLAHSWNIRDELIEALERCMEWYSREGTMPPKETLERVLKRAMTVEMP